MKRVMVFGTFDIVHLGHLHMLWEARGLGDELIVVIARDKTVKKIKGFKPMFTESYRKAYINKLRIADKVVLGSKGKDKHLVIRRYKPDIIALGYDQINFTQGLSNVFKSKKIKIVCLKSYKNKTYKSSVIKELLNK